MKLWEVSLPLQWHLPLCHLQDRLFCSTTDTILLALKVSHYATFTTQLTVHCYSFSSHLGKQFLLLSEELFLWDAQVLQSRAGLPPLQSHSFTLLQDIFHLRDVRSETKTLKGCRVKTRGESEIITLCVCVCVVKLVAGGDTPPSCILNAFSELLVQSSSQPGLTIDDMLGRYGLLVGLVAYFIGLGGDEVYELCAAVNHQLSGVVGHSDIGESFFNHLVDSCSGDGEVVVVSRGRSHRGGQTKPQYQKKLKLQLSTQWCKTLANVYSTFLINRVNAQVKVTSTPNFKKSHQTMRRFLKVSRLVC